MKILTAISASAGLDVSSNNIDQIKLGTANLENNSATVDNLTVWANADFKNNVILGSSAADTITANAPISASSGISSSLFIGDGSGLTNVGAPNLSSYLTIADASSSFAELTDLAPYATLTGVTSSFTTPVQVTGAITNFPTRTEVTASTNSALATVAATYLTIVGASNTYASKTQVTGALASYATLIGVSGTFATPTNITSALSPYLTTANASSSFAELVDLTASNITNFTTDVRNQISAGTGISISNGQINTNNIPNSSLANSATTLGSTTLTLGSTTTNIAGLSSITSTAFTGSLNGNASTSTTAQTASYISTGSAIATFTNDVRNQISAGTGISISSGQITNSDRGSSQFIFKNITDGTNTAAADTNSDTFKLRGSNGVTVTVTNDDATHGDSALISLSSVPNSSLANSTTTLGSTTLTLGSTTTSVAGLSSVTSTGFTGSLLGAATSAGSATTATTAQTASYVATGSAIATFTNDVRNQFSAGTGITINSGQVSTSNIPNASLTNSSITINGSSVSLGGTITVGDITSVTAGTNMSGGGTTGDITLNLASSITGLTNVSSTAITGTNISGTTNLFVGGNAGLGTIAPTNPLHIKTSNIRPIVLEHSNANNANLVSQIYNSSSATSHRLILFSDPNLSSSASGFNLYLRGKNILDFMSTAIGDTLTLGATNYLSSFSFIAGQFGVTGSEISANDGIYSAAYRFPSSPIASANANTLDDYEEGTWTPTLTSSVGATLSNVVGKYTKIGNVVTAFASFNINSFNGGSGALTLRSLPFACNSSVEGFAQNFYFYSTTMSTAPHGYIATSTSAVTLMKNGGASGDTSLTAADITAAVSPNATMKWYITYLST